MALYSSQQGQIQIVGKITSLTPAGHWALILFASIDRIIPILVKLDLGSVPHFWEGKESCPYTLFGEGNSKPLENVTSLPQSGNQTLILSVSAPQTLRTPTKLDLEGVKHTREGCGLNLSSSLSSELRQMSPLTSLAAQEELVVTFQVQDITLQAVQSYSVGLTFLLVVAREGMGRVEALLQVFDENQGGHGR